MRERDELQQLTRDLAYVVLLGFALAVLVVFVAAVARWA